MNRAVIGARVHSGWAALVAVCFERGELQLIDRRRMDMVDSAIVGSKQPYHFAENLDLPEAEQYLINCNALSERLASAAVDRMAKDLRKRDLDVTHCAIVLAAGRPLPALPEILASHALIHTAEGEFFRQALRCACENHGIGVTGIRERDLEDQVKVRFGSKAPYMLRKIADWGRSLGPPWTLDQKAAALAAWMVLADPVDVRTAITPSLR